MRFILHFFVIIVFTALFLTGCTHNNQEMLADSYANAIEINGGSYSDAHEIAHGLLLGFSIISNATHNYQSNASRDQYEYDIEGFDKNGYNKKRFDKNFIHKDKILRNKEVLTYEGIFKYYKNSSNKCPKEGKLVARITNRKLSGEVYYSNILEHIKGTVTDSKFNGKVGKINFIGDFENNKSIIVGEYFGGKCRGTFKLHQVIK